MIYRKRLDDFGSRYTVEMCRQMPDKRVAAIYGTWHTAMGREEGARLVRQMRRELNEFVAANWHECRARVYV